MSPLTLIVTGHFLAEGSPPSMKISKIFIISLILVVSLLALILGTGKKSIQSWYVYKNDHKVLWIQNKPGTLVSTALLSPASTPKPHPFLTAQALDPLEENNLLNILSQSKNFEEFVSKLKQNGYSLKKMPY